MEVRSKFSRPVDTLVHINSSETQKLEQWTKGKARCLDTLCLLSISTDSKVLFHHQSTIVLSHNSVHFVWGVKNPKLRTTVTFITCAGFFFYSVDRNIQYISFFIIFSG